MTLQDVLDAARRLAVDERKQLFEALWADHAPENWPAPSEEWIAEINRRSAAYDAGQMTAAPWTEVRDRARHKASVSD